MSKSYLPYEPDQQLLLPAALQEWLPDDHLAYFISDVVDQLDMSEVTARYERERRGGPPYHPRMMVKVLLYGYCVGVASSRRIAQRLHEDIAFRVLAANNTPDFRTISDFRKDNVDALSGLFVQVLALCQQAGLVKLGHVALDGTKVKANASKHKAMSYQRMKEKAAQLAAEVAELLRQAQAADDEEDRRYGKDKRGDELPEELAFREGRLEKIREAMAALEAEAQAAAEQAEAEGGNHPGVPDDKAQRNFTDTESRIIPAPGGKDFLQAYNCQAVVDSAHQVIVAARATNQTSDKQQAAAMMEETIDNVGAVPREVSADAGYYSAKAVDELYALGVDPFVAPEQTRHGRVDWLAGHREDLLGIVAQRIVAVGYNPAFRPGSICRGTGELVGLTLLYGSTVSTLIQLPGFALDGDVLVVTPADRNRVDTHVLFGGLGEVVFPLWPF